MKGGATPGATRSSAAAIAALALALSAAARADDATPVALDVGEAVKLCKTGLAACPTSQSLCDDPKVALVENGSDGPELKGISPGTTLCSVLGPGGAFRRILRVTVKVPAPAPRRGS